MMATPLVSVGEHQHSVRVLVTRQIQCSCVLEELVPQATMKQQDNLFRGLRHSEPQQSGLAVELFCLFAHLIEASSTNHPTMLQEDEFVAISDGR